LGQVGQRVAGVPMGNVTKRTCEQGFQLYTIVSARSIIAIPENMPYQAAVTLPLGILTAAAGLYEQAHLQLPLPCLEPKSAGKTLLVWGGSSSVGVAAIQLAVASGFGVVATASEQNFEMMHKAGATAVFDRNDSRVIRKILDHLQDKTIVGAFDCML
jgi:NADPH:quinone reductase-like Zn-dependent oxidoreductase